MDEVLVQPPKRNPKSYVPIRECPNTGLPLARGCLSCSTDDLIRIKAELSCVAPRWKPFQLSSHSVRCYQNYCGKTVIVGAHKGFVAVSETLIKEQGVVLKSSCSFVNSQYSTTCSYHGSSPGFDTKSLSADHESALANISTITIRWRSKFVTDVLQPLDKYTKSLVDKMGQLISITGTAFDEDLNGIADDNPGSAPSHMYRVLIACTGPWANSGSSCVRPNDTMVLSFIFPHINGDVNCLPKDELLMDYTARLHDVELISGLQFHFSTLSRTQLIRLKTHINTKLW